MKNLKLKSARAELDMSQAELAQAVGVTRQTINLIESGEYNPTIKLCIAICKVLRKTLDQIFWFEEEVPVVEQKSIYGRINL
ncbi:MAG: helix-turn-helix transcriptional regulator [Anaeroplasmataceae bacterium]|nr:helix-turn-helix transcriptional regulator [Anaeroplasmataceae bacterium]MDE6414302.1 helix-turn-helix transcriptional regulator [Anaeroplasmataceae bacterium]